MRAATLTGKGQITLPKPVREYLGVDPGDGVDFMIHSDGSVRVRALDPSVDELYGMLRRPGDPAVALEEMERGVAEHLAAEDDRIRRGQE